MLPGIETRPPCSGLTSFVAPRNRRRTNRPRAFDHMAPAPGTLSFHTNSSHSPVTNSASRFPWGRWKTSSFAMPPAAILPGWRASRPGVHFRPPVAAKLSPPDCGAERRLPWRDHGRHACRLSSSPPPAGIGAGAALFDAVAPDFRGRGVAGLLMRDAENGAPTRRAASLPRGPCRQCRGDSPVRAARLSPDRPHPRLLCRRGRCAPLRARPRRTREKSCNFEPKRIEVRVRLIAQLPPI